MTKVLVAAGTSRECLHEAQSPACIDYDFGVELSALSSRSNELAIP